MATATSYPHMVKEPGTRLVWNATRACASP
jgi:hypothetical protein